MFLQPIGEITLTSDASRIREMSVAAYTVPTDLPESDGTLAWNETVPRIVPCLGLC